MNAACRVTPPTAAASFDRIAPVYDDLFTRTVIGRAQRKQVWNRLLHAFPPGGRILELNCGTGEDAAFLATRGHHVVACDASPAMIQIATQRASQHECGSSVEFQCLANEQLSALSVRGPFDGALSNFSGLNCVADLSPVAHNLAALVKPGGPLLLCIWSRVCLSEILWYLLHGQAAKAFRRLSGQSTATVAGTKISVFYPTVRKLRRIFYPWFRLVSRCAVGLFVPPSYVEQFVSRYPWVIDQSQRLDMLFADWPILRGAGDHVLLEFARCRP
jgi:2-polyprenyl-3-methyl-5-hydroxy-6-metoxy-1,4-benzoquinol methylase